MSPEDPVSPEVRGVAGEPGKPGLSAVMPVVITSALVLCALSARGGIVVGLVILAIIFFPHVLIAYLAAGLLLKRRPVLLYRNPEEEVFWRSVSIAPGITQFTRM